jgi:hypothetical protein
MERAQTKDRENRYLPAKQRKNDDLQPLRETTELRTHLSYGASRLQRLKLRKCRDVLLQRLSEARQNF